MRLAARNAVCLAASILATCWTGAAIAQQRSAVLNTQPRLENDDFLSVVPISTPGNKIFLDAAVNGKPYRFIFDTGSPTILAKSVADDLGLVLRGQNTGQDANGNLVVMDLAVLDRLSIGDVVIRNIPVFVFDFSQLEMGHHVIDGGIIGSEILPLCVWQIDFLRQKLVLTSDRRKLEHVDGAHTAELKVSGYPFTPVLEHTINGTFTDHAMFDTGSTELLHLNRLAFEELKKRGIVDTVTATAAGTFGESAGGRGRDSTYHLVPLKELSIGDLRFDDLEVWTRNEVRTLIGAKILESHIITLDYKKKSAFFFRCRDPNTQRTTFGFKPYLEDRSFYVGFLQSPSPAAEAGMKLHDQILSINGKDVRDLALEKSEMLTWFPRLEEMQEIEVALKNDSGDTRTVVLRKK